MYEFYHSFIFAVIQGDNGAGICITGQYHVMKFLVAEEVASATMD
jgi:hypothetical protein